MNCLHEVRSTKIKASAYATSDDFCQVFEEYVDDLYQLALVLTGNHELAERCFVAGFEESIQVNQVFKQWAHSWARRSIIQNAVRALQPHPSSLLALTKHNELPDIHNERFAVNSVFALEAFERFVFVLTVLDQYTDQDCADLLNCPVREILKARLQAFEQIVNFHRASSSHETAKNLQETNR